MAQQTTQSLGSVDRALSEIQASLIAAPNAADIRAAMRLKSTFDMLVDLRKPLAVVGLPLVTSLSLVDADGGTVNTSRGSSSVSTNVSERDFFAHFKTYDDRAAFVGTPVKDPSTGDWTVAMARRIDDPHGGFSGLVVAELSLTNLQQFYRFAMPARRSVYLVRHDGVILVRYPPQDAEIGMRIPDKSPWFAAVAKGGGTFEGQSYFDATPIIAAVYPLRDLPFVVSAAVTEADTLSEWYQQRLWVVVGGMAAVICVVALLRLFGVQYRRLELSQASLARKNAELDTAHQQLDATLTNLSQGICLFTGDRKLVVFNRSYCDLYDLQIETIRPGMSLTEIAELRIAAGSFAEQPIAEYLALTDAIMREGKLRDLTVELRNGRTLSIHVQPLSGRGWVATHEDITERRAAEAKIAFLARHDVLTGLANRALFLERLQLAVALAERGRGFALLCLDLDRFKAVNDTYGHPAGDSLLRAVADRLQDAVRDSDTVARLGGDEFAILQLEVSDASQTTLVARRIVQSINEVFEVGGNRLSVGTSIGIAMAPADGLQAAQLMKCADLALYRCKQEGRGAWRYYEPAMDAAASKRLALEVDLRDAVALGQLELHYQPLVSCPQRRLRGFETLLRWRHPVRGLVQPGEFVSVAEEVGLIGEIGAWVMKQALAEASTWPDHLRVAVNLSTKQFRGGSLVTTVTDAIQASGISADRVELEITESALLQDDDATLSILHDLHGLGARIALDDFGTGYSSLSYLRSFPFDTIKIDRSFVAELQSGDKSMTIISGIIGLAANLHMSVTAEGVETEEQFDFLVGAGCTDIQGFLISKPVTAREIPALIERLSGQHVTAMVVYAELTD